MANQTALSDAAAQHKKLSGHNLLMPGSKYDSIEIQNDIKAKRVGKIMSELKNSIKSGKPISVEADKIVRKVLGRAKAQ